ncbi:MAG: 16S rRNA (guanine(966)-N(2))-methyltransferase RsmD [Bdellovibrionales bacterium]|nr:16S rRNA (guanine(966)-N(2))-methyltransferase RsmD [Bdellovibrionales bacterium]
MLRITGGQFGGRKLHSPADSGPHAGKTRPTQAKLRQALFNTLQFEVAGARVLDLFAGAGTLGFEALSRGAASVLFVEASRPVCKLIERNATDLGIRDSVEVLTEKVEKSGSQLERAGPFDLVLADPPYLMGVELDLLSGKWFDWRKLLSPGGKLYVEWGRTKSQFRDLPDEVALPEKGGALIKIREKNYGDSILTTYQLKGANEEVKHDS